MFTDDELSEIEKPHQPDYDSVGSCLCGEVYPCTTLHLVTTVRVLQKERWAVVAMRNAALNKQDELQAKVEQLQRERDLAVAHDLQDYPTVDAYEAVCKALREHRDNEEKLRERIAQHQDASTWTRSNAALWAVLDE